MRKVNIVLFVSTLACLSFFSCTKKPVKTVETSFNKKYYLVSDTTKGALTLDFLIELPSDYKNKAVLDSIRKVILSNLFGSQYISFSNDSVIQAYAENLRAQYKENNESLVNELDSNSLYSFNNEHRIEGFSLINDKHLYSYGIERYSFMGGAHGLDTRNYFNFDLKSGKRITEVDIFKSGSTKALIDLIKRQILEDVKANQDKNSEIVNSFDDTGYWTDSIKPNGNFYITDESINYVFNPYEIGPYYIGQTEVILSYAQLKDLLKPESIISYLVEAQTK